MTKMLKISAKGEVFRDPNSKTPTGLDSPQRVHLHASVDDRCSFGLLRQAPSLRDTDALNGDELVLVLDGELGIIGEGDSEAILRAGDCAVIPAGRRCRIDQSRLISGIFMHSRSDGSHSPVCAKEIVRLDLSHNLTPTTFSKVDLLLGPIPRTSNHTWYSEEATGFSAGVWSADAYSRKIASFTYTELMHFVAGSAVLTDEDGTAFSVAAGDTLLVPVGTKCLWHSEEKITKIWCVQE
ncbi:cupin domain-containing protein [Mesorhizobium sp. M1005]|uniref:cupin domain-containing protein n=1 Tax=unclassified Mesorhizobium TaxID=325217 RepID=UPI0033378B3D